MPKPWRFSKYPSGLSLKQERFADEYLVDFSTEQAAIRAGYAPRSARISGAAMLRHPEVRKILSEKARAKANQLGLSSGRVLLELQRLAFSDLRGLFDLKGNLKPIHQLTDEQAAILASVEIVKQNLTSGDGIQEQVHKVKLWDKTKALDMLGRYFKLFADRADLPADRPLNITLVFANSRDGTSITAEAENVPDQLPAPVAVSSTE